MPRGNRMGPPAGGGRGSGTMAGQGRGRGGARTGGARTGAGPGGECLCPKCGTTAPHQPAVPCFQVNCPGCGTRMVRK